jgi:hypothetical protein
MTITTAEMAETLSIELPSCPLATIRDMIRWAQRELCSEGNAWISRGEPVVAAADTDYAELEIPVGAEAIRIISLNSDGRVLRPGIDYTQTGPNSIVFLSRPTSAMVYGELACRPSAGLDMPPEILTRWSEALMDGARYRLFMLPQSWREPNLAEFFRRKFMDSQADCRSISRSGYQAGSVKMQFPRFI